MDSLPDIMSGVRVWYLRLGNRVTDGPFYGLATIAFYSYFYCDWICIGKLLSFVFSEVAERLVWAKKNVLWIPTYLIIFSKSNSSSLEATAGAGAAGFSDFSLGHAAIKATEPNVKMESWD